MKDSCIVLEGGGLRGAFTSGVLEFLIEKGINFDRVIGVSAGACVGASFLSGQRGRNRKVNVEYPSDSRYMGLRHLITTGSYFNMKFVFGELPQKLVPFDKAAFYDNPAGFDVVTTSLSDGRSVIFSKEEMKNFGLDNILVASSSIPLLSRPATLGGKQYFDGGVSDSIPVRVAFSQHKKCAVVLTRPRGYRKEKSGWMLLPRFVFRRHPQFLKTLLSRNEAYNQTLDFCDQMEKEGKLFIIAPSPQYTIGRAEKNPERRMLLYQHGYDAMSNEFERLRLFFE